MGRPIETPIDPGGLSPMTPLLSVADLHAYYGKAHILHGVSFAMLPGEVVALVGRNGAGKSTTMKAVMGLVPPAGGAVRFAGSDIAGREPYEIARLGLGYVPEERRVFSELTVMENLTVGERPARADAPRWTPDALFDLFPNLGRMKDRPGGQMSGGEQQMLTIARTLMGNPRFVLLDEPSEGLAPVIIEEMAKAIQRLRREGLTVLISEQNLHFARLVAGRALVMEKGIIRFDGGMDVLMADTSIRERYLAV
jgi:branched-chain amino acid transport system ATP-binding protein